MRRWFRFLWTGVAVFYALVLFAGIFVCGKRYFLDKYVYLYGNGTLVQVSYGRYGFHISSYGDLVLDKSGLSMDSGCSSSFLMPDSLKQFRLIDLKAVIKMKDANGQIRDYPLYYLRNLQTADGFKVKNVVVFPCYSTDSVTSSLGMDVISAANWHFCFKDSCMDVIRRGRAYQIPERALCFSYERTKNPKTVLNVGDIRIDGCLLDMGMSDWDFCLTDSAISNVLQKDVPSDSVEENSYGLNSAATTIVYQFDSLNVMSKMFADVRIRKGVGNIIGMDFFRRFDHMFWDSGSKKVYLWDDVEKNL